MFNRKRRYAVQEFGTALLSYYAKVMNEGCSDDE